MSRFCLPNCCGEGGTADHWETRAREGGDDAELARGIAAGIEEMARAEKGGS